MGHSYTLAGWLSFLPAPLLTLPTPAGVHELLAPGLPFCSNSEAHISVARKGEAGILSGAGETPAQGYAAGTGHLAVVDLQYIHGASREQSREIAV